MSGAGSTNGGRLRRLPLDDLLSAIGGTIEKSDAGGLPTYWVKCSWCQEDVFLAYEPNDAAASVSILVHMRECEGALPIDKIDEEAGS